MRSAKNAIAAGIMIGTFCFSANNGKQGSEQIPLRPLPDDQIDEILQEHVPLPVLPGEQLDEIRAEAERLEKEREQQAAEQLRIEQQKAADAKAAAEKAAADRAAAEAAAARQTFKASHYTATCNGCSGLTATGVDVSNTIYTPDGFRVVAVDPSIIALGSILEIKYPDGTVIKAKAADVGGAIKGHNLDVLVGSVAEAYRLGRPTVSVRILGK